MGVFGVVTLSGFLGFLSLAGFVASWVWTIWPIRDRPQDRVDRNNHGVDDFSVAIRTAWMVSPIQGVITVEDLNSEHRVVFRTYEIPDAGKGLEFGFPIAEWSRIHTAALRDHLRSRDISFRENEESFGEFAMEVRVDCGKDIDKAAALARLCFMDLYGVTPASRFKTSPSSWPTQEEIVGSKVVDREANREFWRRMGMGPSSLTVKAAAYTFGLAFFGYPALWLAWFLADAEQPDWRWSFGTFHLSGSYAAAILLLVFIAACVGWAKTARGTLKYFPPRHLPLAEYISGRIANWLISIALPLAVVTSWVEF